jgi:tetratricopeptide (TPR) repeat protein
MEVPREGPKQKHFGPYFWPQVIQHEYAHTITLSQTRNRIPHWLTEAAAVSIEGTPRDLDRVMMLVDAYKNDRLFDLDEINWAFIRPRRPGDRQLAYAQGHWMVEFMDERFGSSALVRLIERYYEGEREEEAIPAALQISREEFYQAFLEWAGEQVKAWGYAPEPAMEALHDELRATDPEAQEKIAAARKARLDFMARAIRDRIGTPAREDGARHSLNADEWPELQKPPVEITDEKLATWLEQFPDQPDLLMLAAMRSLARLGEPTIEIVALLEKYSRVRPADPTPHKTLALYWQRTDTPQLAIPHLEELDVRSVYDPVFAVALAKLYRDQGQFDLALAKIEKAVNTNPFDAPNRELAAAIAIQAGNLPAARLHVVALTILEPDRPQHQRRLEAIDAMIGEREASQ